MADELNPGDPFLFMKVGVHANETLEDIIKRKRGEIEKAGVSFWGYGGSSCHPLTAVQPFVKEESAKGVRIRLLMQEIVSRHYAEGEATEYSVDGKTYLPIPKGVKVLGSRYALVLKNLDSVKLELSLAQTRVGIGRFTGRSGTDYIRGHVDKACLVYDPSAGPAFGEKKITLGLAAELDAPYAVLLRSQQS